MIQSIIAAHSLATLAVAALLTAPTIVASAATHPAGSSVYQSLLTRYRALKSFQATIRSKTVLQPASGKPNTIDSTINISYRSPNLVHIEATGLMGGGTVVSDGRTLYTYSALTDEYSSSKAPADPIRGIVSMGGASPSLRASGHVVIDGRTMNQYSGVGHQGGKTTQFQVDVDPSTNLIRRTIVRVPKITTPQGDSLSVTSTQDFTDQKLNPSLSPSLFRFTPPSGAQKSDEAQNAASILGGLGSQNP